MLNSSLLVGEDVIFRPSLYLNGVNHSLHSIFGHMARRHSLQDMRRHQPDIIPEFIATAREILIDRNRALVPGTQGHRAIQDYKVLVDENISAEIIDSLQRYFRKVFHVHDIGLTGKKDDRVWQYALENKYDIIFTKDRAEKTERDLAFMAVQDARSILRAIDNWGGNNLVLSDLPLIARLDGHCDAEIVLKKLLRNQKEKLFDRLDNRATPYLDIVNEKLVPGPTYLELRGNNYLEDNDIAPSAFTCKKSTRELFKSMWLGRLNAQDIRNMDSARENKIDDQIDHYIAMQGQSGSSIFRVRRLALQEQNLSR